MAPHPDPVIVTRNGHRIAAIIPLSDLDRIWADEDFDRNGPVNPETGRRYGPVWVAASGWRRPASEIEVTKKIERDASEKAARDREFAELEQKMKDWDRRQMEKAATRKLAEQAAKAAAQNAGAEAQPEAAPRRGWRWFRRR